VSLYPSIGNWSLDCKSHYWIKQNQALWADEWNQWEILAGRAFDKRRKAEYFARKSDLYDDTSTIVYDTNQSGTRIGFWDRILRWLHRNRHA